MTALSHYRPNPACEHLWIDCDCEETDCDRQFCYFCEGLRKKD